MNRTITSNLKDVESNLLINFSKSEENVLIMNDKLDGLTQICFVLRDELPT